MISATNTEMNGLLAFYADALAKAFPEWTFFPLFSALRGTAKISGTSLRAEELNALIKCPSEHLRRFVAGKISLHLNPVTTTTGSSPEYRNQSLAQRLKELYNNLRSLLNVLSIIDCLVTITKAAQDHNNRTIRCFATCFPSLPDGLSRMNAQISPDTMSSLMSPKGSIDLGWAIDNLTSTEDYWKNIVSILNEKLTTSFSLFRKEQTAALYYYLWFSTDLVRGSNVSNIPTAHATDLSDKELHTLLCSVKLFTVVVEQTIYLTLDQHDQPAAPNLPPLNNSSAPPARTSLSTSSESGTSHGR
jgi:hypothetical protein